MTAEEFKRMFLEALRDDPEFRRAVNVGVMSHAMEKAVEYYGGDAQEVTDLRKRVINEALGIEEVVEIDRTVKWESSSSLDWSLYNNNDVTATNFVARVARVRNGVAVNYFMGTLRKDVDYTKEIERIEEALSYLELTQFIQVKV